MKLKTLLLALACTLTLSLYAQEGTFTHPAEALDTLRNIYQEYPFHEIKDTPAPKGYKPFYITNYGRHGSRYIGKENMVTTVLDPLEAAEKRGNLTETGKRLLAEMREFRDLSDGMYGMLTEKGGDELAAIGKRFAERYPEVFGSKKSRRINCHSSTVQRCILSMGYYVSEILREYPELEPEYLTGARYQDIILNLTHHDHLKDSIRVHVDRMYETEFDKTRLWKEIFVNPEEETFTHVFFVEMLHQCAANVICIEKDIDLFKYLTLDEIMTLQRINNNRIYATHGNSAGSAKYRLPDLGLLVNDIISKADAAIAGNGTAADLRFGHDSGLMPLNVFFNLEGFDTEVTLENAHEHFNCSFKSPMSANLHLVLYRSRKSDVILAKVLFNEQEMKISGLEPVAGPYYDWNELSAFLKSRLVTPAEGERKEFTESSALAYVPASYFMNNRMKDRLL